jgi:hypothetical protein
MRKWRSDSAHFLLHYVAARETSLRYKFTEDEKMKEKIELAGTLAHQLLMCKDNDDYLEFIQCANLERDKLNDSDANSKLREHLEKIITSFPVHQSKLAKKILLLDYDKVIAD